MLTLALAAALIGFGLLVAALITSNFWIAVACVIVCVVGLALLIWDIVRSGRLGAGPDDPPLFTIRDQVSEPRAEPLANDPDADAGAPAQDHFIDADTVNPGSGLGTIVNTGTSPGTGETGTSPGPGEPLVTGDAHDYIKSITGSFPIQAPASGSWPLSGPASPAPPPQGRMPRDTAPPSVRENRTDRGPNPVTGPNPATGPIPANSPYVGRRRRTEPTEAGQAAVGPTAAGQGAAGQGAAGQGAAGQGAAGQGAAGQPIPEPQTLESRPRPPAPDRGLEAPVDTAPRAGRISAPKPAADLSSETFVVHDHTGPLPKITIVDPDA